MKDLPKIVLRSLTHDDVDAWTRLLALEPHHDWTRALVHDEVTQIDRRPHGAFVEGALVGAIAIQVIVAADEVWILDVTVANSARRLGVGRALVDEAKNEGRARGYLVWLEVRASNVGARALYRHMGFTDVGMRKSYYAPREAGTASEDAVLMRCLP